MASFRRLLFAATAVAAAEQQLPASCDVAAVGAGWAGVYYAFRMATSGKKVCVFEGSHRVGGRTYSHTLKAGSRKESFTLDVGAYRFSPDMHLPGDIILDVLQLPVACYEPSCPPAYKDFPAPFQFNYTAPLVRIVNAQGMPAGYATAIEGLMDKIKQAGGELYMGAPLTDLKPLAGGGAQLMFGNQTVLVKQVLLNLPRTPLLSLPSMRAATPNRTVKMQECVKFDTPTSFFPAGSFDLGKSLTKGYAFYEDAWWHTKVDKTEGQCPENAFEPAQTSEGIPIGIHFNDGPVRCEAPGKGCRGFLEVFYSPATEDFFEDLRPSPQEPLGTTTNATQLARLHRAVMEATKEIFNTKLVAQPQDPPTLLVVGVWDRTGEGYTAPTKVYYSTSPTTPGGPDPLQKACGVPGLSEAEYRNSVLMPLLNHPEILVANNDWVASAIEKMEGDWAQESLLQAERGLKLNGFERPEWLNEEYYNAKVLAFLEPGSPTRQTEVLQAVGRQKFSSRV
eukprot:CAMPEP_0115106308 /NCGR_PEP_ID=MMETSP0227-20121206/36579_1 /TAXON_ID=89957 /ORGANISM="Polarella glacialis, Strain CCMP 1383" /LENGTH=506 /DNA_ID=CAMNT_0002503883 /DNA_START=56 /DNA_END=1576 /DNA_ORIENTATION=-